MRFPVHLRDTDNLRITQQNRFMQCIKERSVKADLSLSLHYLTVPSLIVPRRNTPQSCCYNSRISPNSITFSFCANSTRK